MPARVVCTDEVAKLLQMGVSPEEINSIWAAVLGTANQLRKKHIPITPEILTRIKEDITLAKNQYDIVNTRVEMLNTLARTKFQKYAANFPKTGKGQLDALEGYLVGVFRGIEGERASVDAKLKEYDRYYEGLLYTGLKKIGSLDILRKGDALDKDLAIELFQLQKGGKVGITGNKLAIETADLIGKLYDNTVDKMNKLGSSINKLEGYITKQIHERSKIVKTSKEEWKSFILDRLDQDKTFGPSKVISEEGWAPHVLEEYKAREVAEKSRVLDEIYDSIVYEKNIGFDNYTSVPIKHNMGARVSSSRHLHFKSPESFLEYNTKYGSSKMFDMIMSDFHRRARVIGVMENLGPAPKNTLEKLVDDLRIANKDDPDFKDRATRAENMAKSYVDYLTGDGLIPESVTIAKIGQTVRNVQAIAKLGGVVISAVGDVPHIGKTMHYAGDAYLTSIGKSFISLLHKFKGEEVREVAELMGTCLDGFRGSIISRFYAADQMTGTMSKVMSYYFKLTGLEGWTDWHKAGVTQMLANFYGRNADKAFDALNGRMKRTLKGYGISPEDWEVMRTSGVVDIEGKKYMIPNEIMKTNEVVGRKLHMAIADLVDQAVLTPGTKERAKMLSLWGYPEIARPGTVLGECIRCIMQFKSFSITTMYKAWARDVRGVSGWERAMALPHYAIALTGFGYLALLMKDAIRGKTPRDVTDVGTWGKAFLQGGGAALFGDFINSSTSRFGNTILETMLGPTAGLVSDLWKPLGRLVRGEPGRIPADLINIAKTHAPLGLNNLIYTRVVLDYLLLYGLQEYLSPGYLRRIERETEKNEHHSYYAPPSKYAKRW
jgi:hypothetical protein